MNELQIIEHESMRVLTTAQLSQFYETDVKVIRNNFNRNKERYSQSKHYYCLEGEDLKAFRARHQIEVLPENINKLYLWTKRGAMLHAKSLGTDKAWEMFEMLVDFYFDKITSQSTQLLVTHPTADPDKFDLQRKRIEIMERNSKTKQASMLLKIKTTFPELSPQASEVIAISAAELIIDKPIDYRPKLESKTYSATDIANEVGSTSAMVGRVANANNLKTSQYGIEVLDKSRHSNKEIPNFRYNEAGRQRLLGLFDKQFSNSMV